MGSVAVVRRESIHHVEEVLGIAQIFLRWDNGLTDSVAVAGSSDGWGASDDTVDVLVSLLASLVDVGSNVGGVGLRVEGGHGGHQSGHHSHGVGVVAESLNEWFKTIVIGRVLHHFLGKALELFGGGELAVDEEEGGLEEVRLLSELLDGVTTVLKDTLLSVDERDARDAVHGVHIGGII